MLVAENTKLDFHSKFSAWLADNLRLFEIDDEFFKWKLCAQESGHKLFLCC
jgi:hypothetical protein